MKNESNDRMARVLHYKFSEKLKRKKQKYEFKVAY